MATAKKTGFRGYTADGLGTGTDNGYVKSCIFAINYPYQILDINFNISTKAGDWGAQMGDGSIIPLSNPIVIYQNKDNSIVQFTMDTPYPSNSPCFLVYTSDTANMTTTPINDERPFIVNSVSGQFAFTTDKYGSNVNTNNGYVNRLVATIHFFYQVADADFSITTDASHWGVRMGNGTIINLRNPSVIAVNDDSAVVVFTMDTPYPSNSPGILVYRSAAASYTITPRNGSAEFVAVTGIDLPISSIVAGSTIDLSCAEVTPYNSTNVHIDWAIVSGDATLSGTTLTITGTRNIRLMATIANGSGTNRNFSKYFDIAVITNNLRITQQPISRYTLMRNIESVELRVSALSDNNNNISYQWYKNTTNSIGGSAISGATSNTFDVPNDIAGNFYYYCRISSRGTTSIVSNICHITVGIQLTGINITPSTTNIELNGSKTFTAKPIPSDAVLPQIQWTCNNQNVLLMNGSRFTAIAAGTATITATSVDGKFTKSLTITVAQYTAATDIQGIPDAVIVGESTRINGIVIPSTATKKTIKWSIADTASSKIASITEDGVITPVTTGMVTVKATITDGITPGNDFSRVYGIQSKLDDRLIPVTDIGISLDLSKTYRMNKEFPFTVTIQPSNASVKDYSCKITRGSGIIRNNNSIMLTSMNDVVLSVTVPGGSGTGSSRSDFVKNFTIHPAEEITPISSASLVFKTDSGYISEYLREVHEGTISLHIRTVPTLQKDITNFQINIKSIEYGKVGVNGETADDVTSWAILPNDDYPISLISINSKEIEINTGKLMDQTMYKINYKLIIFDATDDGALECENSFYIFIALEDIYIPVRDIEPTLPSVPRVFYPILPGRYSIDPITATDTAKNAIGDLIIDNMDVKFSTSPGEGHVGLNIFNPVTDVVFHTTDPNPLFEWGYFETYAYPQTPGGLTISLTAPSCTVRDPDDYDPANPTKINFTKSIHVDILDPFIPVSDITIGTTTIEQNRSVKLVASIETGGGLDSPNPYWDEEEATNQNIVWSIDPNSKSYGSITKDGVLTCLQVAEISVIATIESGIDEELLWYPYLQPDAVVNRYKSAKKDKWGRPDYDGNGNYANPALIETENGWVRGNVKVDFIKKFKIRGIAETTSTDVIAIITINTNRGEDEIYFHNETDFSWLCSDVSPSHIITYKTGENMYETYSKGNITKITFTDRFPNNISLKNFGMNCTSLIEIVNDGADDPNQLPLRTGEGCYENFLRGCTKFNQEIIIPEGVRGKRALKNFMRDCTSFNSTITLPKGLTGESVLHGFLRGCTKFNQSITIPDTVTGKWCLRAFLYGCTLYNKPITLPAAMSGHGCLYDFLTDCESFNQNITLPTNIVDPNDTGRELCNFMKNCHAMISTINIPKSSGLGEPSQQTLSSTNPNSDLAAHGVTISGTGASNFLAQVSNNYDVGGWPYTHFKNLD